MKDVDKLKNYRTKYKRYYGIDFGSDYVIHHIDGDHDNNDIENLLLLPSKLHSRYHWLKTVFLSTFSSLNDFVAIKPSYGTNSYGSDVAQELRECIDECSKWVEYKNRLDMEKWLSERGGFDR